MKREKSLIKNIFILAFGTVIPKIASLVTLPLITAALTKTEYGTYDLITTLVSLFLPVATLQMQSAAFRFLINERKNERKQSIIISNIVIFSLIMSILALAILFFTITKISIFSRLLILVYYFFDIMVLTLRQIGRGLSKNKEYSKSVVLNSLFELLCIFVLVTLLNLKLNGVLYSLIIGQLVSFAYLFLKLKIMSYIKLELVSKSVIKELVKYSWPLIPNSLSSWVMNLSDRVVITMVLGLESNAIYAIAYKLPNLFSIVQNTFNLAWQENASIAVDDTDSSVYYSKMFNIVYTILFSIMACIICSTPILFKILIRGNYNESYNHIPILFLSAFFAGISSYLGGIYIAHKKSLQIGLTTFAAAILNFLINVLFIKKIGIYAASISTVVSYLALMIFRMINIQKIQKINYNFLKIIVLIIILIIMNILCFQKMFIFNILNIFIFLIFSYIFNRNNIKILLNAKLKKRKKV